MNQQSRRPSDRLRRLPPWAPDLIQRFVPLEELHRKPAFKPPAKRVIKDQPFDPFY